MSVKFMELVVRQVVAKEVVVEVDVAEVHAAEVHAAEVDVAEVDEAEVDALRQPMGTISWCDDHYIHQINMTDIKFSSYLKMKIWKHRNETQHSDKRTVT